jgi:hypothetical protein
MLSYLFKVKDTECTLDPLPLKKSHGSGWVSLDSGGSRHGPWEYGSVSFTK